MRFDSAGWGAGFVGCLADWLSTRNWGRISLGLLPVCAAAGIGGLVACGCMLDRGRVAERYLKLADAEVPQWENAWAPAGAEGRDLAAELHKLLAIGQLELVQEHERIVSRLRKASYRVQEQQEPAFPTGSARAADVPAATQALEPSDPSSISAQQ